MTHVIIDQNTDQWLKLRSGEWCQCLKGRESNCEHTHSSCRIGASELATVCGLNPFADPISALEKRIRGISWNGNAATRHGHEWELPSATLYDKIERLINPNSINTTQSGYWICNPTGAESIYHFKTGDDAYFGASLDRISDKMDVEIKCPFKNMYTQVPIYYLPQVHMQMAIRNRNSMRFFVVKWENIDIPTFNETLMQEMAGTNQSHPNMIPRFIELWHIKFSYELWKYMLPRARAFCRALEMRDVSLFPKKYWHRQSSIMNCPAQLPHKLAVETKLVYSRNSL